MRRWFSGEPCWVINGDGGTLQPVPWGFTRDVEHNIGAVCWVKDGNPAVDEDGSPIWDSLALWGDNGADAKNAE
ncbi:hypothetical protein MFIFM68171_02013 [Madurella fahalii]|uniref:Uncharacterized protein n=1 Tax=Madurella fahalii TaxID=1157608 RepID=A0ABQ0G220_9PEZI